MCLFFEHMEKSNVWVESQRYVHMYVYTYVYMYVLFPVCILCFTLSMCDSVRMSGTGGPLAIGYSGVLPTLVGGGWVQPAKFTANHF